MLQYIRKKLVNKYLLIKNSLIKKTKSTLFKTQNKGALTMNNVKYIPYLSIKQQKKDELNKR